MTYENALKYIKDTGKFGSKLGLEVMRNLLSKMGDPQKSFKSVHIAGTNGKGSTSSYISNALNSNGYKVGLFSSPPIIDEMERIQIDGKFISKDDFAEITEFVKSCADTVEADGLHYPTEFELFTAVAFEYFKRQKVDFAVVEVGLGGKLDATNVCEPCVSVIMTIALDHTQWLGSTLEEIAGEKAGIIKENVPVVLYPEHTEGVKNVFYSVAKEKNAPIFDSAKSSITLKYNGIDGSIFDYEDESYSIKDVKTPLIGLHQVKNCQTALKAMLALKDSGYDISVEATLEGFARAKWPGRFDIVQRDPLIIFDGGHNEQCMQALTKCVDLYLGDYTKILVFSMFADKDCVNSVKLLKSRFDERIVSEMVHPRRAKAEYIASLFEEETEIITSPDAAVKEAVQRARNINENGGNAAVVVCGSLNLLEELMPKLSFPL